MKFAPYRHQEEAFDRLASPGGRSTLIATGTGSGKTECFLYPILDHCLKNREPDGAAPARKKGREGVAGRGACFRSWGVAWLYPRLIWFWAFGPSVTRSLVLTTVSLRLAIPGKK